MLSGCALPQFGPKLEPTPYPVEHSTPITWRKNPDTHDFIAIALSGGGTKAAVFSGEAMFTLQALGLLPRVSLVSSVSGGSFAGALYALSCDPGSAACGEIAPGRQRPVWRYDAVMKVLGQGYQPLVNQQIARFLIPFVPATISADDFALYIDRHYLGGAAGQTEARFADLNPARPPLALNATIVSEDRVGLDSDRQRGCLSGLGRNFLRRRTPDEFFHFAFTDYYFGMLGANLQPFPLAGGVAASGAFPALIDTETLTDRCHQDQTVKVQALRLLDGGANDNQGLIEILAVLGELAAGQHRSDHWNDPDLQRLQPDADRAYVLVVNSSVTEATGLSNADGTHTTHNGVEWVSNLLTKVGAATDTYSAVQFDLRKQLYLAEDAWITEQGKAVPPVVALHVSLTGLDQYAEGGTVAALWTKSALTAEDNDIARPSIDRHRAIQSLAWSRLQADPDARAALRLPPRNPQCYYDIRAQLDASLISLSDDNQACLREAARWATVLRAQEMCEAVTPQDPHVTAMPAPAGLDCSHGVVRYTDPRALDGALPGDCARATRHVESCQTSG
jgi:hypothetical protein